MTQIKLWPQDPDCSCEECSCGESQFGEKRECDCMVCDCEKCHPNRCFCNDHAQELRGLCECGDGCTCVCDCCDDCANKNKGGE